MAEGFTYSYDMLGEAALTKKDARKYFQAYKDAIAAIARHAPHQDVRQNPGISIKLSALHPRYERMQYSRVMKELVPLVLELAVDAKEGGLGLNIDAEEADRLDLSLDVIEAVLKNSKLQGWDGFGVVVQAYNKAASYVIDHLYELAERYQRNIMLRLVKGAYWDSEIKHAQMEGVDNYPVFTRKAATDISYLCCANKLLGMTDRIYPQFATHNAHTVAAILAMSEDESVFEFQRLHGMGEALYRIIKAQNSVGCRIYAPVGRHKDLLAYLVRRLLENGANSSFVNQIVDLDVPIREVVSDPFSAPELQTLQALPLPADLYLPERTNSKGMDLNDPLAQADYLAKREAFKTTQWHAQPLLAVKSNNGPAHTVINPANASDVVGTVCEATLEQTELAIQAASDWSKSSAQQRSEVLNEVANLYEKSLPQFASLLCREAGKTAKDVIAEVREAVDFLRYYAAQSLHHQHPPQGIFTCISPWNFPLAIFTGQISAALAAGNGVLAKPAETTPLVADVAVKLFYQAGVPKEVLQLLPGQGTVVGAALTSSPQVNGVCFTGSTATAQMIHQSMAAALAPSAPLIAETGGLNAMIVDSTALPEQAVKDIIRSAFQSAGQRCSALRVLYVQEDIYEPFTQMLFGAMDELYICDPWNLECDVGPLISSAAKQSIQAYIDSAANSDKVLKSLPQQSGNYVASVVIEVNGIQDLAQEVFGPVLHLATFKAEEIEQVIEQINQTGYGLTFGLHTRIDGRVEHIVQALKVGNIYVNRDQIGAVVGSQPFGGEGLSGTGPKAGGPRYLQRFYHYQYGQIMDADSSAPENKSLDIDLVQTQINELKQQDLKRHEETLPGVTGESNKLSRFARGVVLCLGPSANAAREQAALARQYHCTPFLLPNIELALIDLSVLNGFDAVAFWGSLEQARKLRQDLANRKGPIIPLVLNQDFESVCITERHVCVDTTASGGNVSLLAAQAG